MSDQSDFSQFRTKETELFTLTLLIVDVSAEPAQFYKI